MRRVLLNTSTFVRAAKRTVKRDRRLAEAIRDTIAQLSEDAFHPTLKTHKLKAIYQVPGRVVSNTICGLLLNLLSMRVQKQFCSKQ